MRPVRVAPAPEVLRDALLGGALVTVAMFFACLGVRSDVATAIHSGPFWTKLIYGGLLAGLGWRVARCLGNPQERAPILAPLLIPVVALTGMVAVQGWPAGAGDAQAFWFGSSWSRCSIYIAALSAPIAAGLLWAFRGLAPTRPRLTGLVAGLVAGAIGAAIYSLGCGETSAGFILVWYTLGILLPAAVSAAVAPALLRW